MKLKKCNVCNQDKLVSEFHKNKGTRDGYLNRCKKCINENNIIIARNKGINPRGLVFGVGVMDLKGESKTKAHRAWESMIRRCYSEISQEKLPTYKDKYVCDSWLIFSNFKLFHDKFYFDGAHLDKDILVSGNKVYSPETCLFVSPYDNALFGGPKASYPQGVHLSKRGNKFISAIRTDGKKPYIGCFDTLELAHKAATQKKSQHIYNTAMQREGKLKDALTRISLEIAWSSITRFCSI